MEGSSTLPEPLGRSLTTGDWMQHDSTYAPPSLLSPLPFLFSLHLLFFFFFFFFFGCECTCRVHGRTGGRRMPMARAMRHALPWPVATPAGPPRPAPCGYTARCSMVPNYVIPVTCDSALCWPPAGP